MELWELARKRQSIADGAKKAGNFIECGGYSGLLSLMGGPRANKPEADVLAAFLLDYLHWAKSLTLPDLQEAARQAYAVYEQEVAIQTPSEA